MDLLSLKSGTDIRGIASGNGITLTADIARDCASAFTGFLREKTGKTNLRVAVGHDPRISSPSLAAAVIEGLSESGVTVFACGPATTPSMFFATRFADTDCEGAVEITASHLPGERNGLKFFTKDGGLEADDILWILSHAAPPVGDKGQVIPFDILTPYGKELSDIICRHTGSRTPFAGQHIIVNAGNGMGGFFAEKVLSPLGADISGSVNLTPDGTFPVHIPNPENPAAMKATSEAVLTSHADLGICFDTDCDRAAIVDADGKVINSCRLIALISAIILEEAPGSTIVTDSVTSTGLAEFIAAHGGKHLRYRRGYKNVIDKAIELEKSGIPAPLAIETSGHAALKENCFLDDGAYLIVRLLCKAAALKVQGKCLSDLIADLPEPAEKEELRIQITVPDFRSYGEKVLNDFHDYILQYGTPELPSYEGVRANLPEKYGDGWCLMRLSVHDPVLPINMESNRIGGCAVIRNLITDFLDRYDGLSK